MYLFDDIGAKFGFRKLNDMILELVDKRGKICLWTIEDVLENIIAKLILRQLDSVLDELVVELIALLVICMVYTALENTAAMFVRSNLDAILRNSIKDKLH
jgi:hypothetical protein